MLINNSRIGISFSTCDDRDYVGHCWKRRKANHLVLAEVSCDNYMGSISFAIVAFIVSKVILC